MDYLHKLEVSYVSKLELIMALVVLSVLVLAIIAVYPWRKDQEGLVRKLGATVAGICFIGMALTIFWL